MNKKLWQEIHNLNTEGLSIRATARRLGIHRRTVRSALDMKTAPPRSRSKRGSIIDAYRGWLLAKLEQYPELSAARLFEMLRERGYTGSCSLVRQCVAELRPRLKPAYLTLAFAPGECAQVDWGSWGCIDMPGGRRKLSFFTMVLCHSRMLYAEFFIGESLEHWLRGHRNALEYFNGVPAKIMVDNCKTAVLCPRRGTEQAKLNPNYEDFAQHYGFRIMPCNVRRPNEKGRVEKAVGYIRTSFLAGRVKQPPEVLAPALADWLENVANKRIHGTTGRSPVEMFVTEEKNALKTLPAGPHECCNVSSAVADSRFRVTVDNNRYSVPSSAASRRVVVYRYVDRIVIKTPEGEMLADHPRCSGRRQEMVNPDHERALVMSMRHARDKRRLENFLTLGSAAADYLAGLREKRPNWRTHVDRINALAEIHGRNELARVLADGLLNDAFSAEYVYNIIDARKRIRPVAGPLHVTRRADLLELELPEPNLDIY